MTEDEPLSDEEVLARLYAARPEALYQDDIDFRTREARRTTDRRIQITGKGVNGYGDRWNIER